MANIDKVIDVLCEDVCKRHEQMTIKDLSDLTKALADLVMAKSKMGQSEIDINEMAFKLSSKFLREIEKSKVDGTRMKEDVSNKKRDKPSVEVGIKVDSKELDEAIEKAKQLTDSLREAQKTVDSLSNKRCTSDKDRVLEAFILASKEIIESESLV